MIITAPPTALLSSSKPGALNTALSPSLSALGFSISPLALLLSTSCYAAQALRNILVLVLAFLAGYQKQSTSGTVTSPRENPFSLFAHNMSWGQRHSPVGGDLAEYYFSKRWASKFMLELITAIRSIFHDVWNVMGVKGINTGSAVAPYPILQEPYRGCVGGAEDHRSGCGCRNNQKCLTEQCLGDYA